MSSVPSRLLTLALLGCLLLASPAQAGTDTTAAEIQFVFGSDTSSGGIRVDRYDILYAGSAVELYLSPTGNAARIMDPALRHRLADSHGNPMQMTWWMQGGSLYHPAANTNVPVASTMPLHLMKRYHSDAIAEFGDELTFHYHTWIWSDDSGDGRFLWNQAWSFEDSRADFDRSLAQHLIEEDVFPVTFRSGWHYMDNAWQQRLDELLPFSMHNASPYRAVDTVEPLDNNFDWSRATLEYIPFRPAREDYQVGGGTGGWNVRSSYAKDFREEHARAVFEKAESGQRQVVVVWSHLAEPDYVEQFEDVVAAVRSAAADHPGVDYRFTTGIAAMQRWLRTDDRTAPSLDVALHPSGESTELTITSDEALFQPAPFVAVKDVYERHHVVDATSTGPLTWRASIPWTQESLAHVAIAATDSSGNLTTHHISVRPDDIFIDNEDDAYSERRGTWTSVSHTARPQVWGRDYREAVLEPGAEAEAAWTAQIEAEADYHVFIRRPDVAQPAGDVTIITRIDGTLADSVHFADSFPADEWVYAGTIAPAAGSTVEVTMHASAGDTQATLAADAVRLTPLIRDRQLATGLYQLDLGERVPGEPALTQLHLRNLGTEEVVVSDLRTSSGAVDVASTLPITVPPLSRIEIPLAISSDVPDIVHDTLLVVSDDATHPRLAIPLHARFTTLFVIADDADPEHYLEAGNWQTSVAEAYGNSSRYAGTGAPSATATFTAAVPRQGLYDLSFIVPASVNSAVAAEYRISINDAPADTLVINQNEGSGGWRSLDLFELDEGDVLSVTVGWAHADQSGLVLRADAMRLSLIGSDPDAFIVDDEDDAVYQEFGDWRTSSGVAYGARSRYAFADGEARATYAFAVDRSGVHSIEFIVPASENGSPRARYRIIRNGTIIDSVFVDQTHRGDMWRILGSHLFLDGDQVEVEVSHAGAQNAQTVLRADAVRLRVGRSVGTSAPVDAHSFTIRLHPNYPNPFRASTTFAFETEREEHVEIRLYDLLGRRVATVVDERFVAGRHTISFDGVDLASGMYLCRMTIGAAVATRPWIKVR